MSEWIKYSEQKPEKDGKYFVAEVYKDWHGYDIATYFASYPIELMRSDEWFGPDFYIYWDEEDIWAPVRHYGEPNPEIYWMPIPELPKEEK